MIKPSSKFLADRFKAVLLLWIVIAIFLCVHVILSTLFLVALTISCDFVTFPILGPTSLVEFDCIDSRSLSSLFARSLSPVAFAAAHSKGMVLLLKIHCLLLLLGFCHFM